MEGEKVGKRRKVGRWEDWKNLEIVLLNFSTLLHFNPSTLLPFYPSSTLLRFTPLAAGGIKLCI